MEAAPVQISLNGMPVVLAEPTTLYDLLCAHQHDNAAVATAVNEAFIARSDRTTYVLKAGDSVTIFCAIVGG